MCLAWYRREQWDRWKAITDDKMFHTFDEWLEGANDAVEDCTRKGMVVHRTEIDVEECLEWAKARGLKIDGHSRSLFAVHKHGKALAHPYKVNTPPPTRKELAKFMRSLNGQEYSTFWEPYFRRPKAGVCPIFRSLGDDTIEQFGSGVLFRIGKTHFLLTAAHVLDDNKKYELLIPGEREIIPLNGHYAGMRMPESGNRYDDRYDVAYIRFEDDYVSEINSRLMFLNAQDCDPFDVSAPEDTYLVVGYPAAESTTTGNMVDTPIFTFSGEGVAGYRYKHLNLDPNHHLLVQFRPRMAYSHQTLKQGVTTKFPGVSGGGVYAWDKRLPDPVALRQPKLAAIVTEFRPHSNVFIATRISCFLACIRRNNPDLPIETVKEDDGGNAA